VYGFVPDHLVNFEAVGILVNENIFLQSGKIYIRYFLFGNGGGFRFAACLFRQPVEKFGFRRFAFFVFAGRFVFVFVEVGKIRRRLFLFLFFTLSSGGARVSSSSSSSRLSVLFVTSASSSFQSSSFSTFFLYSALLKRHYDNIADRKDETAYDRRDAARKINHAVNREIKRVESAAVVQNNSEKNVERGNPHPERDDYFYQKAEQPFYDFPKAVRYSAHNIAECIILPSSHFFPISKSCRRPYIF
jgi:hypothetical protein